MTANRSPSIALRRTALLLVLLLVALAAGCATLGPSDATPSHALTADRSAGLGRLAADSAPQGSAFRALPMAALALDARLALIARAHHGIDLQAYLLHDDDAGHRVARALRDAAARGVRVRVLVDDLYTADSRDLLLGLAAHAAVELRLFNPFPSGRSMVMGRYVASLFDFARVNHRMHNKLLVVDGAFAIAGGRNIGDEYFRRGKDGNFVDFDLLVAGDVVADLDTIFDGYWNSPYSHPLHALEPPSTPADVLRARFEQLTAAPEDSTTAPDARDPLGQRALSLELGDASALRLWPGRALAMADDPHKVGGRVPPERSVTAWFVDAVSHAQTRVTLVSPYFIPGERGLDVLRRARERGVQIELVTNTVAANAEAHAGRGSGRSRKARRQRRVAF